MKDAGLWIGRRCSMITLRIFKPFEVKYVTARKQNLDPPCNNVGKVFDFITNILAVYSGVSQNNTIF